MLASCWVARKIFRSAASSSSSALTLDSRPTTNGVIIWGKMTTSRMGIIGRRRVSDFSFELNIAVVSGRCSVASRILHFAVFCWPLAPGHRPLGLARFLQQGHIYLLVHHHLL